MNHDAHVQLWNYVADQLRQLLAVCQTTGLSPAYDYEQLRFLVCTRTLRKKWPRWASNGGDLDDALGLRIYPWRSMECFKQDQATCSMCIMSWGGAEFQLISSKHTTVLETLTRTTLEELSLADSAEDVLNTVLLKRLPELISCVEGIRDQTSEWVSATKKEIFEKDK